MVDLAICAIFKDERKYIKEWISYHSVIGFNKFFLYDNGSTDDTVAEIGRLGLKDAVKIIDWPERPGQLTAYAHFLASSAKEFEWVAFIDIDEFIHPLEDDTIHPSLARAGNHPGILINWLNFGPSGHESSPEGLVIENYTKRLPENNPVNFHVKTIARPSKIKDNGGAHIRGLYGDPCNAAGVTIPNAAITPVRCELVSRAKSLLHEVHGRLAGKSVTRQS